MDCEAQREDMLQAAEQLKNAAKAAANSSSGEPSVASLITGGISTIYGELARFHSFVVEAIWPICIFGPAF